MGWWLLALLLAILALNAVLPHRQPQAPFVEVRRALPVVPRALPVTTNLQNAQWQPVTFADGTTQQVYNRGWLASTALLPGHGQFVGDAYVIDNHYWIWQHPAGQPASWIDP
jgi:hypothetical protein